MEAVVGLTAKNMATFAISTMFMQIITRLIGLGTILSLSVVPFLAKAESSSLQVNFPNGGESLEHQNVYPLQWSGVTSEVKLSLLSGEGITDIATTKSRADGTGIYLWAVPSTLPVGQDYRLVVTSGEISDVSDQTFNVINFVDTPQAKANQLANIFQILDSLVNYWK